MRYFYASSFAPFHWIFWASRTRSQERVPLKTERLFFSVPFAFAKRSLSVPGTHSLLGYFCPVLYINVFLHVSE